MEEVGGRHSSRWLVGDDVRECGKTKVVERSGGGDKQRGGNFGQPRAWQVARGSENSLDRVLFFVGTTFETTKLILFT
jgi:preprotein translocase subunit SecG